MKQRISFVLMLLSMCFLLSGCAIIDCAENKLFGGKSLEGNWLELKDNSRFDKITSVVAENAGFAQNKETFRAGEDASKAAADAKYDYWYDKETATPFGIVNWLGNTFKSACATVDGWSGKGGTKAHREAKADAAIDNYQILYAEDATLHQARKEAGLEGFDMDGFSFSNIPTGFLIAGTIILLLLLFLLLRKPKKQKQPEKEAAPVIAPDPVPEPTVHEVEETKADLIKVDPEKQAQSARARCEKWGLDYEALLAEYDGDPVALNQKLIVSRPEDFK